MLQTLMLLGLGFLAASLIAFLLAPFLWRYAVHVTKQHIRQTSPLTMGEIQADRDQLRAEHALTKRKLEIESEKLGSDNKNLKIEIAELKKRQREISEDISMHGAEIKSKDELLTRISNERDQLKNTLVSREKELKEAQQNTRREKNISTRSATALKEANGLVKTKENEVKTLRQSIEKLERQFESGAKKLKIMEGHISRVQTCTGAVKSLSDELLNLEKDAERFLKTNFTSKTDFSKTQKKLLKGITAFITLEKSVRKQWAIASKAEAGGRAVFAPLKGQINQLKSSVSILKRIIEKTDYVKNKPQSAKPASDPVNENKKEEDITKRIRSLENKLSA